LPASEKSEITESGQPVKSAKGVVQEHRDATRAVYKIGSGDYDFEVRGTEAH